MAINIPSKTEKQRSQLLDALRILAWQQYRIENKVSGLEDYKSFSSEWDEEEIHNSSYKELQKLIKSLEYTEMDLLQIRSEYYRRRGQINGTASIQASLNLNEPINDDSEPPY